MNLSFYSAAVGVAEQQQRLNVHGNNIANINTYGYKTEKPSFAQLMYDNVDGIDGEILLRGAGSRLDAAETDFKQSSLYDTGLPQDYAIEGDGFFALLDPSTGEYSYTRDGSFSAATFTPPFVAAPGWYLSDGNGRLVISNTGRPIAMQDPDTTAAQEVGVFDFINYNGMLHLNDNRVVPVEKNGNLQLGRGRVVQGCLERSNADLANEMTKVIETQRSFSYMMKMIIASDEIENTVNNLR